MGSATLIDTPTALYRLFDVDGRLLYVGVTLNLGIRWRTHSGEKPGWGLVASATVEHYPNRLEALVAEKHAIREEHPLWNVVHNQPSRVSVPRAAGDRSAVADVFDGMDEAVATVVAIADPIVRAREAGEQLAKLSVLQMVYREMRQAAVLELRASRWSYAEIGRGLGLHRNRVQQIAEGRTGGGKGNAKDAIE